LSSRLLRAPSGKVVAVEVTTPLPELEVGYRFQVLGNEIRAVSGGFGWTGEPTGRPPLPTESAGARRPVGQHRGPTEGRREWTDADRERARALQAEGLSQSQIALEVCGDRKFRSTVQLWLKHPAVAVNGDGSSPHSDPKRLRNRPPSQAAGVGEMA
jgi:hypothetical protein